MFRFLATILLFFTTLSLFADEGMWLLSSLKGFNESRMKELGLKIPIEEIVGGKGALSNAVVSFGGIGTGSFISKEGLILTNYHCSYSAISQYNSQENNMLDNGYWASSKEKELRVKGLSIVINKEIIDVSNEVVTLIKDKHSQTDIALATKSIGDKYKLKYNALKAQIKSYKNNSIFILYLQEVCEDIRLVGLLPKKVAKFGGETDNWQWPRYNADFAFFRAYKNNLPYVPDAFLRISKDGYSKGDFAMSLGYPGTTDRQASSSKVYEIAHCQNPPLIEIRSRMLSVIDGLMKEDQNIRNMYYERWSNSANYYKNAVGMNDWISYLDVVGKKKKLEAEFEGWVKKDHRRLVEYASPLDYLSRQAISDSLYIQAITYFSEAFSNSYQMLRNASMLDSWIDNYCTGKRSFMNKKDFIKNVSNFFGSYNTGVDKVVTKAMFHLVKGKLPSNLLPSFYETIDKDFDGNIDRYVDYLFDHSVYADPVKVLDCLNKMNYPKNDPAILLNKSIEQKRQELSSISNQLRRDSNKGYQSFQKGLVDFLRAEYYPNADKSLRLSYGIVDDLKKRDGKIYPFMTSTSGILEKSKSENPDYYLDPKLKSLISTQSVNTCFITNGDVTGGNSGSPMLNGRGELIGLVFDCNWESMTRDFNYDITLNRVICADINYILFLTEKYANVTYLTDEILTNQFSQKGM